MMCAKSNFVKSTQTSMSLVNPVTPGWWILWKVFTNVYDLQW